jgi:hypothetical protein
VGRNLGDASGTGLASSNLRTFSAVRTHANLGLLEHTARRGRIDEYLEYVYI